MSSVDEIDDLINRLIITDDKDTRKQLMSELIPRIEARYYESELDPSLYYDDLSQLQTRTFYHMSPAFWETDEFVPDDEYKLIVDFDEDGIVYYVDSGIPVVNIFPGGIYVIDLNNTIYMTSRTNAAHSDFKYGAPVIAAGEFKLNRDGTVKWFDTRSGHYSPDPRSLNNIRSILNWRGVDTRKIKFKVHKPRK